MSASAAASAAVVTLWVEASVLTEAAVQGAVMVIVAGTTVVGGGVDIAAAGVVVVAGVVTGRTGGQRGVCRAVLAGAALLTLTRNTFRTGD